MYGLLQTSGKIMRCRFDAKVATLPRLFVFDTRVFGRCQSLQDAKRSAFGGFAREFGSRQNGRGIGAIHVLVTVGQIEAPRTASDAARIKELRRAVDAGDVGVGRAEERVALYKERSALVKEGFEHAQIEYGGVGFYLAKIGVDGGV